jgi:hypothetical protein
MFHRVLATSVIGAAALAAPLTAMAADVGCGTGPGGGTGAGAETPTAIVVHLPKHVEADEPVTVSARITPQQAAQGPSGTQPGKSESGKGEGKDHKGRHKDKSGQGEDQQEGKDGTGTKGDEPGKEGKGGHHGHKGAGHGKKGKKHHKKGAGQARRHAVTGEVEFFLDGKAEPPVEVSRDQASEKIEIPLGRHTIYAEYSGDGDFEPAKSAPVTFELTNDQDGQGGQSAQGGQDQDGRVGTSTQTGLENPAMGQTDPDAGRDSGDLTPGEQDQSDWGQDSDDQDGPQDQA